ncbi:MAG: cell division protein ZapA [Crocinitomicaceae bacterium]|nr:cell division protein ZapA [Crocinitomicaceae bacterium]
MDKLALKIIIAGRTYPLTIKKEEENAIKAAADKINSNIKKLQGSYAVKDMQDLLAMTALQLAIQKNSNSDSPSVPSNDSINETIQQLISEIDKTL